MYNNNNNYATTDSASALFVQGFAEGHLTIVSVFLDMASARDTSGPPPVERCASQLVIIYWLCQHNNSHMVKPKTLQSEVEALLVKSRQTLLFHRYYGFVVISLFIRRGVPVN